MRYPFNRFYTDTIVFAAFTLLVVVLGAIETYFGFINYAIGNTIRDLENGVAYFIVVVMAIMIFVSHVKGYKNALHALMGAFLVMILMKTIPFAIKYYTFGGKTLFESFFMTYVTILAASTIFFFINHFIINSKRRSNPYKVFANQLVSAFLLVGLIVFYVQYLSTGRSLTGLFSITTYVGICNMISCVESNIDNARELKEKKLS